MWVVRRKWVWVVGCGCGGGGSTGRKVISLYKVIIQELLIEQYYTIGFEKNAAGFKAVK